MLKRKRGIQMDTAFCRYDEPIKQPLLPDWNIRR